MILFLRTSDIAKAVGVHPNTIRLYEAWGLLPPIPRGPSGYRLFTEAHLDQMCLARIALGESWPGRNIRHSAVALEGAYDHLDWCKPSAPRPSQPTHVENVANDSLWPRYVVVR